MEESYTVRLDLTFIASNDAQAVERAHRIKTTLEGEEIQAEVTAIHDESSTNILMWGGGNP